MELQTEYPSRSVTPGGEVVTLSLDLISLQTEYLSSIKLPLNDNQLKADFQITLLQQWYSSLLHTLESSGSFSKEAIGKIFQAEQQVCDVAYPNKLAGYVYTLSIHFMKEILRASSEQNVLSSSIAKEMIEAGLQAIVDFALEEKVSFSFVKDEKANLRDYGVQLSSDWLKRFSEIDGEKYNFIPDSAKIGTLYRGPDERAVFAFMVTERGSVLYRSISIQEQNIYCINRRGDITRAREFWEILQNKGDIAEI